jgi:cyclopropane-fatty-acyl-phospholipid synthase
MGNSTVSGPVSASGTIALEGAQSLAEGLLRQLFGRMPIAVPVRLWTGAAFNAGAGAAGANAPFVLVFRRPRAIAALVLDNDPLRLAEAYFHGEMDIEGDLFAALALKDHLENLRLPLAGRVRALVAAIRLKAADVHETEGSQAMRARGRTVKVHSREENRESIHFHYDVSNEFYQLWLDRSMVYSCGYFERDDATLDEAQTAKLEHICRKLLLEPGERFLDVGCGWGALVMHAARHHGVIAHGITLSRRQLEFAQARIAAAGLADRVTVELRDYRDLPAEPTYDKVASVGMFEHVGLENLPVYFEAVQRVLKPGGLFLNHGITHANSGWEKNLSTEFINRYVFPDGELDSIGSIQSLMEQAQFEITDVEGLRLHYARTLRAWVERLERRQARALEYVNEATYRVWRLYMAACALEFEGGNLGIYQVLAAKRGVNPPWPLTRRHLYVGS